MTVAWPYTGGGCGVGLGLGWGFGAAFGAQYIVIEPDFDDHSAQKKQNLIFQLQDRVKALRFPGPKTGDL